MQGNNFRKRQNNTLEMQVYNKKAQVEFEEKELSELEIKIQEMEKTYLSMFAKIALQGYSIKIIDGELGAIKQSSVPISAKFQGGKTCYETTLETSYILINNKENVKVLDLNLTSSVNIHLLVPQGYGNFVSKSLRNKASIENKLNIAKIMLTFIEEINKETTRIIQIQEETQRREQEMERRELEDREIKGRDQKNYNNLVRRLQKKKKNALKTLGEREQQVEDIDEGEDYHRETQEVEEDENEHSLEKTVEQYGESSTQINLN